MTRLTDSRFGWPLIGLPDQPDAENMRPFLVQLIRVKWYDLSNDLVVECIIWQENYVRFVEEHGATAINE